MIDHKKIDNENFIQLEAVSKWFESPAGRFSALNRVNLKISQGEYVAVVGKSGSGKSTLLNMLTGIDHPSEGVVTINATQPHTLDENHLARWRGAQIGIVFQFFQLIPTLTIRENLRIAMDFVDKIPARQRDVRTLDLLEQMGILQHKDKYPLALSGGEQQRAAIARALANDPPVLVADEPTGNLDAKTGQAVAAIFSDLVKAKKTVIIVTHENVSLNSFQRIVTLSDGNIVSDNKREA